MSAWPPFHDCQAIQTVPSPAVARTDSAGATEFDLEDVLGDTLKSLALRAHQKGLEVACHLGADVPAEDREPGVDVARRLREPVSGGDLPEERSELALPVEVLELARVRGDRHEVLLEGLDHARVGERGRTVHLPVVSRAPERV